MTPIRKRAAVTLTINTTMTTDVPAADIGGEPAAAAGDWPAPAPEGRRPYGPGPRSGHVRSGPGPHDLEVSGDPEAAWDDPPSRAGRAGAGS